MISNNVTIIVPVYGDWPSLKDCIVSLTKHVDTTTHKVIFINDCGPQVELMEKNIKSLISGKKGFRYYKNDKNLGFVGTCNRAVSEVDNSSNDVLLLNSDTKVTAGFIEEMLSLLHSDQMIGTVSPRSNNATICTLPISAIREKGVGPEKAYKLFKRFSKRLPRYSEAPTAHGFCILIKRKLIKKYGLFDTVFGKGYGEEVDFCQRIAQHGYKNIIAHHAFVFHQEARSFSLEAKSKLVENSSKIINNRYPNYKSEVTEYIKKETEYERSVGLGENRLGAAVRKISNKVRISRN